MDKIFKIVFLAFMLCATLTQDVVAQKVRLADLFKIVKLDADRTENYLLSKGLKFTGIEPAQYSINTATYAEYIKPKGYRAVYKNIGDNGKVISVSYTTTIIEEYIAYKKAIILSGYNFVNTRYGTSGEIILNYSNKLNSQYSISIIQTYDQETDTMYSIYLDDDIVKNQYYRDH